MLQCFSPDAEIFVREPFTDPTIIDLLAAFGFRFSVSGFRVSGFGFRFWRFGFRVSGFRAGSGLRVSVLLFEVSGFGFRVLGCRV